MSVDYQELMTRNEELHPDLVPYFEEGTKDSWSMLRSPLVYQVPFFTNAFANYHYIARKKLVDQLFEQGEYRQMIWHYERPYRFEVFEAVASRLSDQEYWSLLAEVWTDTENAWQYRERWMKLYQSKRPMRHALMDAEESTKYDALPDTVTIYRGCQQGINENGLSWTLDKKKAQWFATRFQKDGVVLERTVPKSQIIAYYAGRGEEEVIVEVSNEL